MNIIQRWEVCSAPLNRRAFIDELTADGWEPMQVGDKDMWFKRPLPPTEPVVHTDPSTTRKSEAERENLPRDHPDHSCSDCGIHHDDCKECGTSQGEGHLDGCKWLRKPVVTIQVNAPVLVWKDEKSSPGFSSAANLGNLQLVVHADGTLLGWSEQLQLSSPAVEMLKVLPNLRFAKVHAETVLRRLGIPFQSQLDYATATTV